jgi:hypothetical protein
MVVAAAGATDDQIASVDDAIALWRADGVPGLARGDGAQIAIDFADAGGELYGFYDAPNATIYVNLGLTDPGERTITLAHELGHALGLVHVAPSVRASVMNPSNLTVPPNDGDAAALVARWGSCP